MTQETIEEVEINTRTGNETRVTEYRSSPWNSFATKLVRIVMLIGGIVSILLLVRIVFVALGANPENEFAAFIYRVTDILVAPFIGILSNKTIGGIVVDIAAVVALLIYAIATAIVARLIGAILIASGRTRAIRRVQRID
jgi:uncharacterized protein YggT (Ycf19 family)